MQNLLLVDDDPQLLEMLTMLVDKCGFNCNGYLDAESAWEDFSLNPGRYDGAILDVVLPGMSGLELSKRIHKTRDLPILFVTGLQDTYNVKQLEVHGTYLRKEFYMWKGMEEILKLADT